MRMAGFLLGSCESLSFTSPSGQKTQPIERLFGNLVLNAFPSSYLGERDRCCAMDGRLRRDFDRAARTAIAGFRRLVSGKRLSRSASMVVLQQTAEALPAPDLAIYSANFVAGFEKTVVEALVVSAPMVVVEIRGDGLTQHCLTEEDHPAQRFGLEGAEKSLEVRIQIWRSWRKPHALHTFIFEHRTERIAELTVAVHDQVTLAVQDPSSKFVSSRAACFIQAV